MRMITRYVVRLEDDTKHQVWLVSDSKHRVSTSIYHMATRFPTELRAKFELQKARQVFSFPNAIILPTLEME